MTPSTNTTDDEDRAKMSRRTQNLLDRVQGSRDGPLDSKFTEGNLMRGRLSPRD